MTLQKPTLILLGLAVLTAAAIWFVADQQALQDSAIGGVGDPVFANQDFTNIERMMLTGAEHQTTLENRDGRWVVVELGDYPANPTRVAGLMAGLKTAKRAEPKTEDQSLFPRMRLGPNATILAAEMSDGRTLSLTTGDQYYSARGDGVMTFAFDPSWDRAWTIAGLPEIHEAPVFWLNTTILNLSPARIKSLSVTITGQVPWVMTRENPDDASFTFQGVAPDQLDFDRVNTAAAGMISIDLESVELGGPEGLLQVAEARVETFDGLQVQMTFYDRDQVILTELRATYDETVLSDPTTPAVLPDAPLDGAQEAQDLNALWQGNLYQIPLGQLATFLKFRNEFLRSFNQSN
jgi:hypothetical protein